MTSPIRDEVSGPRIDAVLSATFGRQLEVDGFQRVRRRLWGRVRTPMITDLFGIYALKGATLVPRWGFSLSFVPLVQGGHLRWHRTLARSQFDVVEDPLDLSLPADVPSLLLQRANGEATLHKQASTLAPFAVAQADQFWQRGRTVVDLRTVLLDLKSRKAVRFDFYGYSPHPVALAFTLAYLGDLPAARDELSRSHPFREGAPDLQRALAAALDSTSPMRGA